MGDMHDCNCTPPPSGGLPPKFHPMPPYWGYGFPPPPMGGCMPPPPPAPHRPAPYPHVHGCPDHPHMLDPKHMHLFLEERNNKNNSFIANVNVVAANINSLNLVANHMCEIIRVAYGMEDIQMVSEHLEYVNFLAKNIGPITALISQNSGLAFRYTDTVVIDEPQDEQYVITFADEYAGYLPGSAMLLVSYNGADCRIGEQYEEVGDIGVLSNKVKMLFPLRAGDEITFRVIAQC